MADKTFVKAARFQPRWWLGIWCTLQIRGIIHPWHSENKHKAIISPRAGKRRRECPHLLNVQSCCFSLEVAECWLFTLTRENILPKHTWPVTGEVDDPSLGFLSKAPSKHHGVRASFKLTQKMTTFGLILWHQDRHVLIFWLIYTPYLSLDTRTVWENLFFILEVLIRSLFNLWETLV